MNAGFCGGGIHFDDVVWRLRLNLLRLGTRIFHVTRITDINNMTLPVPSRLWT